MEAQGRLSAAWKESGKTSTSTSPKKTSPKRAAKCGVTSRETSRYERGARYARSDLVSSAQKNYLQLQCTPFDALWKKANLSMSPLRPSILSNEGGCPWKPCTVWRLA